MYQVLQAQKLISVLAVFTSVIDGKETQNMRVLNRVPCIDYAMQFKKDKDNYVLALLDSGSEVNAMTPAYTA